MQLLNLGHGVFGVITRHFSQSPPVMPTTSQGQTDLKKVTHIRGKSETVLLFHLFELFNGQAWLDVITSYESLDLSNDVTGILQDQLQLNLTRKAQDLQRHLAINELSTGQAHSMEGHVQGICHHGPQIFGAHRGLQALGTPDHLT